MTLTRVASIAISDPPPNWIVQALVWSRRDALAPSQAQIALPV